MNGQVCDVNGVGARAVAELGTSKLESEAIGSGLKVDKCLEV